MKVDALFIIVALIFVYIAWVATGGPSRPIATAGPFITPVTRTGEESQGYRITPPSNPINANSYPRGIAGASTTISKGDAYTRSTTGTSPVYLQRSTIGPASGNPNQEYITIVNSSSKSVTVSGWHVSSAATGASASIPPFVLSAGGHETVVTGREAAGELAAAGVCSDYSGCVFLNRNLELYAASHETITLTDQGGTKADSFSY